MNLTSTDILQIFKDTGALMKGHFKLTSGLHSDTYFQCAKVLQYPWEAEKICSLIAEHFKGFHDPRHMHHLPGRDQLHIRNRILNTGVFGSCNIFPDKVTA